MYTSFIKNINDEFILHIDQNDISYANLPKPNYGTLSPQIMGKLWHLRTLTNLYTTDPVFKATNYTPLTNKLDLLAIAAKMYGKTYELWSIIYYPN